MNDKTTIGSQPGVGLDKVTVYPRLFSHFF